MSDHLTPETPPAAESAATKSGGEPGWERAALERIALAAITEQRAARRWKILFRFVFLIVLLLAVWGAFEFSGDKVTATGRHTAMITLDGEISADTNAN